MPVSENRSTFEKDKEVDTKYFDKEKQFRKALVRCRFPFLFSIDEIVEHEKAHVETARCLGYDAKFCLTRNEKGEYQPSSIVNNGNIREIPIDDLIAIISAPRILGDDDCLKLRYLRVFKRFYKNK